MCRARGLCEKRFELVDLRAHRELPGREHGSDLGELLLAELRKG